MITIIPIYWMFVVSTRSPVELFGKPDFSPTFFEKIYWKNFTKPFVDGGMAAEPNVNVRVSLFEVSPNPTHDMINAKIVENSFQSANIELRNSKGQMIDSFVTKSRVFQIPVENAGVYHLTMISNGKKSTKQVVVH